LCIDCGVKTCIFVFYQITHPIRVDAVGRVVIFYFRLFTDLLPPHMVPESGETAGVVPYLEKDVVCGELGLSTTGCQLSCHSQL